MSLELPISLARAGATRSPSSDIGGKAASLGALVREALPVPPGLVIPWRAFLGDRDELFHSLESVLGELRFPVAVRSSGSIEDRKDTAAPGLFHTVRGVENPAAVRGAILEVLASAQSRAVKSYCQARRLPLEQVQMSVIIQSEVAEPHWHGVAYTRRPGARQASEMLIEAFHEGRGYRLACPREVPLSQQTLLPKAALLSLRTLALAAESAIGADQGADIEWVIDSANTVFLVQARPIVHPRVSRRREPPIELLQFSDDGTGRVWRWDATHNPDPLSPAQAGLVSMVNQMGVGASDMTMVGGYLYSTSRDSESGFAPKTAEELTAFYDQEVLPAANRALHPLESSEEPELGSALDAYRDVYRVYAGRLTPAMGIARGALGEFLSLELGMPSSDALVSELLHDRMAGHLAARIERVATGQEGLEDLLEYASPMSPAWDVAAPTYREDSAPIHRSIAAEKSRPPREHSRGEEAERTRARIRAEVALSQQAEFERCMALSARAKELSEVDDRLFFRAQSVVRRALLQLATAWSLGGDDIFFLDLFDVAEATKRGIVPPHTELKEKIDVARAHRAEQKQWSMPLAVSAGRPLARPDYKGGANYFRGIGSGGRATGRVVRVGDLGATGPLFADAVVVAPALSPALVFAALGARAIVSAYGGLLGHGAAMARELGIPCVVQCPSAWHALADGDRVVVDGEAGLVIRVD